MILIEITTTLLLCLILCDRGFGETEGDRKRLIAFEHLYDGSNRVCEWTKPQDNQGKHYPEVYWINMDASVERRKNMQRHFDKIGFRHFRVKGVSMKDIYIPSDIEATWNNHIHAKFNSEEDPNTHGKDMQLFLNSLFGRKHKNKLKELGCTMSHLVAMRKAIYSPTATSRYALLVEDDVQFPFDIDFEALASTAPEGFGILQLFNSCEGTMSMTYEEYKKHLTSLARTNPSADLTALPTSRPAGNIEATYLWRQRRPHQHLAFWSTCAFLIDREVLRPIIDRILTPLPPTAAAVPDRYSVRIIAGLKSPCTPIDSPCCQLGYGSSNDSSIAATPSPTGFIVDPPCIFAPQGYQADSYIYALVKSAYVLSIPLITNGLGGNESTFHQDHVLSIHFNAFQKQRNIINDFLSGTVPLPQFAKPACKVGNINTQSQQQQYLLLPPMERVETVHTCKWKSLDENAAAVGGRKGSFINIVVIASQKSISESSITNKNSKKASTPKQTNENTKISSKTMIVTKGVQNVPNSSIAHYEEVFGSFIKQEAFHLVPQLLPEDIIIPSDIEKTWRGTQCRLQTKELASTWNTSNEGNMYVVSGLCGRGANKNTVDDMALTVSHLHAIHYAASLYRAAAAKPQQQNPFEQQGRFALIIEEDVQFPFDLDLKRLIDSAPSDFAILHLTNTDHRLLWQRHRRYYEAGNKLPSKLWTARENGVATIESWATSAYIVNLANVASVIDKFVRVKPTITAANTYSYRNGSGERVIYDFKVIAGLTNPCVPKECCLSTANGVLLEQNKPPCVLSPRGFISDAFVSALAELRGVYSINLPVVVNGIGGRFDMDYNNKYRMDKESARGLQTQRRIVNSLYEAEKSSIPSFMSPACLFGVEVAIMGYK